MDKIVENVPHIYNFLAACMEVDNKCFELRCLLQQVENKELDMNVQLNAAESSNIKKRKYYVETFFELVRCFKDQANEILQKREGRGFWNRITIVLPLDKRLVEGKHLLKKADQLMKEGLTLDVIYTRGMKLPVDNLIGNTPKKVRAEALRFIRSKARVIGIHGNLGAGKTNLMEFLHNDVHDDLENFKAVFWTGAPQVQPDIKRTQNSIAEAMKFKLEDEDVVRRSSLLAKKLKDLAPGHVVIFVDNVKEEFRMDEVGIPIRSDKDENFFCTLVFTAPSEDVCNKMHCSNKFNMDLLPEYEARELFLCEASWNNPYTRSYARRMEKVADDVAKQCARMPLVITSIARSMTGKEDICEWKNCLNELIGNVEDIHGDEAKILEQLRFSYNRIKDSTIRGCFLDSASLLLEGRQMTRQKLIQCWVQKGRISRKCRRGAGSTDSVIYDKGHTIINTLQRLYLLEVVELDGTEYVSMNKWIRKMAKIIPEENISYHQGISA